jgi:hypothetical protein
VEANRARLFAVVSGDAMQTLKAEIDRLNKLPCKCVACDWCHGNGTIRVNYDPLGRLIPDSGIDDLSELETCDQCHGGIVEVCERCMEIEEIEHLLEE